jgi:Fic family protein
LHPPYSITPNILTLIASISEKIGEVNAAHLQKPAPELRRKNRIKTIQSSLEIEGNTLTVEQITALMENKRVLGPQKDILEVQNAIKVYEQLGTFSPYSIASFCKTHALLMKGLVDAPGKFRTKSVGIVKGKQVAHLAPPGSQVKPLMKNLFAWLKKSKDIPLLKSCVFHCELEFIHPFTDGNGRMGRLWQTLILQEKYPVFGSLPVETIVKEKQREYYAALSKSDKAGNSTAFIEFMLGVLDVALEEALRAQHVTLRAEDRLQLAAEFFGNKEFTRQDYMREFKDISAPTASRDLKLGVEKNLLKRSGDKRLAKYSFRG